MSKQVPRISKTAGRTPARRWFNRIMAVLLVCAALMVSAITFTFAFYNFSLVNSVGGYLICTLCLCLAVFSLGVTVKSAVSVSEMFRVDWILYKHRSAK